MGILYQRPGRPVWIGIRVSPGDLQGAIPRSWCEKCGTEVFLIGKELCRRCEKEEENNGMQGKSL